MTEEFFKHHEFRICPCCSSSNIVHLYGNKLMRIDNLDMSYKVGACAVCNFVFAYQLPSPNTYRKYYSELSKYDFSDSEYNVSATDKIRSTSVLEVCKPYINHSSKIADIGCGVGWLLSSFNREGYYNLWGVDPGPSSPANALRCFGLDKIYTGIISEVESLIPINDVELVTLTGVLEHLWNLRSDIGGLVNSMSNGSYLLIEVPALDKFDALRDEPYGELSLEHIQYFSRTSLNFFMQTFGLSCIDTRTIKLPFGTTDSLLGLYKVWNKLTPDDTQRNFLGTVCDVKIFQEYLSCSASVLSAALQRIPDCKFILYGAGSHTARLLANLSDCQRQNIAAIVDSNPNLTGKN
jgi:SAM-dependent methyltransferase